MKHSLLYSSVELEAAILSAHEEISRKDDEILHLKDLLANIIKERDQFQAKCQNLELEKHFILANSSKKHNLLLDCPISSSPTTTTSNNIDHLSHSDSDDNILLVPSPPPPPPPVATLKKPLPENGKFLQAVMEAGPLLQTLLLAGPLPQWQHPPPQLSSGDIPPVTISSPGTKRGIGLDFSPNPKYQKVCSPIII